MNSYNPFFVRYLQPVLRDHFKGSDLALNPTYVDATSSMITALLPMLRRKVYALLPQVATQPQLLSHVIHELMNFGLIRARRVGVRRRERSRWMERPRLGGAGQEGLVCHLAASRAGL